MPNDFISLKDLIGQWMSRAAPTRELVDHWGFLWDGLETSVGTCVLGCPKDGELLVEVAELGQLANLQLNSASLLQALNALNLSSAGELYKPLRKLRFKLKLC